MPPAPGSAIIPGMPGKRWPAAAAAAVAVALGAACCALAAGCYRGSSSPPEAPEPARPIAREPEPAAPRWPRLARRSEPEPERSIMAQAIEKLTEMTDAMCACTDRTCADAVMQEITRWSTEMGKDFQAQKPTDEETREATAIAERLSRCMMKAMGGSPQGSPPTP